MNVFLESEDGDKAELEREGFSWEQFMKKIIEFRVF